MLCKNKNFRTSAEARDCAHGGQAEVYLDLATELDRQSVARLQTIVVVLSAGQMSCAVCREFNDKTESY